MQYRIVLKGSNQIYRVPEDMFDFAAQNLINVGRAEKLKEETTSMDVVKEVTARIMQDVRRATKFAFPFTGPRVNFAVKR